MKPSAQRLKELRDQTGIGVNSWKFALAQTDGDEDLALRMLKGVWQPPASKALENRIVKLENEIVYLTQRIAELEK